MSHFALRALCSTNMPMRFPILTIAASWTSFSSALTPVSRSAFLGTVVISGIREGRSKQDAQNNNSAPCFNSSHSRAGAEGYCDNLMADEAYPGTAVVRLHAVRDRVKSLTADDLNEKWIDVRRKLLWAGGLRDLSDAAPGQGYTGHSFNDYNHVDLTTMIDQVSDNENDGQVQGIAIGNRLGSGIRIASIPELGPGGSWSTCAIGCNKDPPQDVAHIQFRSRVAFKLVWVPNENFDTFVLVDDEGGLLAKGKPSDGPGGLPPLRERMLNFRIMQGSKYAVEAEKVAGTSPG